MTPRHWHFDHAQTAFGWRWLLYRDGVLVANSTIDYATPGDMIHDMNAIAQCFGAVAALNKGGAVHVLGHVSVTDKEPQ